MPDLWIARMASWTVASSSGLGKGLNTATPVRLDCLFNYRNTLEHDFPSDPSVCTRRVALFVSLLFASRIHASPPTWAGPAPLSAAKRQARCAANGGNGRRRVGPARDRGRVNGVSATETSICRRTPTPGRPPAPRALPTRRRTRGRSRRRAPPEGSIRRGRGWADQLALTTAFRDPPAGNVALLANMDWMASSAKRISPSGRRTHAIFPSRASRADRPRGYRSRRSTSRGMSNLLMPTSNHEITRFPLKIDGFPLSSLSFPFGPVSGLGPSVPSKTSGRYRRTLAKL